MGFICYSMVGFLKNPEKRAWMPASRSRQARCAGAAKHFVKAILPSKSGLPWGGPHAIVH
jgi:hypothetical protein